MGSIPWLVAHHFTGDLVQLGDDAMDGSLLRGTLVVKHDGEAPRQGHLNVEHHQARLEPCRHSDRESRIAEEASRSDLESPRRCRHKLLPLND